MTLLIRSASLNQFAEIAQRCGLDPRALVRRVGLPVRCLEDPDLKVPSRLVALALDLAAREADEPAFGLLMAESRRLSNLGPLGLLVRDEPTLRAALEAQVRFIHLHNEALALSVEASGGLVVIREELIAEGGEPLRQATELALGATFRLNRVLLGAQWRPRLVCFRHRAPPSLEVHRRIFGPAVEFGHEFDGIVCNESDLDMPNPAADPVMATYSRQVLEANPRTLPTLAARVRQLVVLLMPRGLCRVEAVASHLGLTRRTVARRLSQEGTSFESLVDQVRRELTARYLEEGTRPLGEVAVLIGFTSPSAFSRWHRQAYGVSVRAQRSSARRSGSVVFSR